ncbi:mitochondrial carrier homolog 2-like isoform X2 [Artemia franciscana]|uniref:mitochondrial carrier homolog 2-like isoform X2 n=1 Tax=Artemia franciscana TaxID=6661 RepID=UPI0032DB7B53
MTDNNRQMPTILDRGLSRAILYPFEYAKILIQIGCEPLEPVSGRSLLGHVALFFPNLVEYTTYIYQRDGFLGLYRGFIPRMIGYTLGDVVYQKFTKFIRFEGDTPDSGGLPLPGIPGPFKSEFQVVEGDVPDESLWNFLRFLTKHLAGRMASVIASQPFMVVATRMCGQFVGREKLYKGILPSVREIFSREGIQGFFAGMTPRLIGEVLALVISGSAAFAVNQFVKRGRTREYISLGVSDCGWFASFYSFVWKLV